MRDIGEIVEKSHYQVFDFLGDKRGSGDSDKKFISSKISRMSLGDKTILDIGCNAGYFLFRLLTRYPKCLTGIDSDQGVINVANELNKEHFKSDKINFICQDFLAFDFEKKFDVIICFSTFHYFVGRQKDFIEKCYRLLNDKGVLLLEIEEYPENEVPEVNRDPRPADCKSYDYPNNLKVKEWTKDKFVLLDRYESYKQQGSLYFRYFYKFQKLGMFPQMRELKGDYVKTVIVVNGNTKIGKSTMCNVILNDKLDYICLDIACIQTDHNIKPILDFVKLHGELAILNVHILATKMNNDFYREWVDYFFKKYIEDNNNLNILLDGCLFNFPNIGNYFLEKCVAAGLRVWKIDRMM